MIFIHIRTLVRIFQSFSQLITQSFADICDANPLDESLGHIEGQGFMAAPAGMSGSEEKPRAFTLLFSNDVASPARSKKKALKLMYLIHKYSRENLLLANIYIKVNLFYD